MSRPSPRSPGRSDPLSPRPQRSAIPPRLGSSGDLESLSKTNVVVGFTPPPSAGLPPVIEGESATASSTNPKSNLHIQTTHQNVARLSPSISTPVDQIMNFSGYPPPATSPRLTTTSPGQYGGPHYELPPRSRRNSAAVVSISLSSRSRSRTPRGTNATLPPNGSGNATPNKSSKTLTPNRNGDSGNGQIRAPQAQSAKSPIGRNGSWLSGGDELDDWQPTGGMLFPDDDDHDQRSDGPAVVDEDLDEDEREWTFDDDDEDERAVENILEPGTLFGEGLEFQGEVIEPAVGRLTPDDTHPGLPLRRGGSEVGKALRGEVPSEPTKKVYQVIRQLGSGSYAVVYLVREKGGRRREYALKCLSKQDLEPEQIETQLFEATIHLSLPIHKNIVTLHQTLHTKKWLFLMLELCPGEDLFYWLEKSRDASPPPANAHLPHESSAPMSSSKFSSSSIPFSSSQMFPNMHSHFGSSFSNSPNNLFTPSSHDAHSPASLLFAHHNHSPHTPFTASQTPPTPSLLSAFAANTLLSARRLKLIASMFSQMCEAVAICHDAGVSHRDIKPENFICCDSIELENTAEPNGEDEMDFGPQAKRKVVVKLTDFGLATAEDESGDVECGSKPYMSYECRNNLGPTYFPAPADVWSLGIVLINMLFHRNPWKDPTPGDPNFDKFLRDPIGFLLSKFTGIGREVASYIADRVLCIAVEDRVSARELGKWIKNLPEMIAGRKAVHSLKLAKINAKDDNKVNGGLFVKSPVEKTTDKSRKMSTSALTSSAPITTPALSTLRPYQPAPPSLATPDLVKDIDGEDLRSASTVDEQQTPADASEVSSPFTPDGEGEGGVKDDASVARSNSTHKRRKRGARKGKAAQAALAAQAQAAGEGGEGRDALLTEFAAAAQSLARDLSKNQRPAEIADPSAFPPLGTTPSQIAAAKKSKWKDLMKLSSGNPELEALARRVAERDTSSVGNWSAPAKLQHDANRGINTSYGGNRPYFKHTLTQTATVSSGFSTGLSSFGPVSSTTSSSGGADDADWRVRTKDHRESSRDSKDKDFDIDLQTQMDEIPYNPSVVPVDQDPTAAFDGLGTGARGGRRRKGRRGDEDPHRAKEAALAAAALTGMDMGPMGAFGMNRKGSQHTRSKLTNIEPVESHGHPRRLPEVITQPHSIPHIDADTTDQDLYCHNGNSYNKPSMPTSISAPVMPSTTSRHSETDTISSDMSTSQSTVMETEPIAANAAGAGVNKPKLKGQIQSLAKMLSGLKTKGKD